MAHKTKAILPAQGLIAHYPLNGHARDISGNDLHGTVYGATPAKDRHGREKGCYSFDGSDYISIKDNDLLDFDPNEDFAISLWAKVDLEQPEGPINDILRKWKGDTQGYPFAISFNNERAPAGFEQSFLGAQYDGSACRTTPTITSDSISYNTFHHIVLQRVGQTLQLFVDNALADTIESFPSCHTDNDAPMTIGCRGQLVRFFKGKIDDIRIYNRHLTVDEITQLFRE